VKKTVASMRKFWRVSELDLYLKIVVRGREEHWACSWGRPTVESVWIVTWLTFGCGEGRSLGNVGRFMVCFDVVTRRCEKVEERG
jgi:hypothetical protein